MHTPIGGSAPARVVVACGLLVLAWGAVPTQARAEKRAGPPVPVPVPVPAPVPAPVAPNAPETPEAVARALMEALIAGDRAAVEGLVAYPLAWDARCRVFAGPEDLRARLDREGQPPPGVAITSVGPVEEATPEDRRKTADIVRRFVRPDGECSPEDNALLERAAAGEQRLVMVALAVKGERVPTVVRVSRREGGWKVTALDN